MSKNQQKNQKPQISPTATVDPNSKGIKKARIMIIIALVFGAIGVGLFIARITGNVIPAGVVLAPFALSISLFLGGLSLASGELMRSGAIDFEKIKAEETAKINQKMSKNSFVQKYQQPTKKR